MRWMVAENLCGVHCGWSEGGCTENHLRPHSVSSEGFCGTKHILLSTKLWLGLMVQHTDSPMNAVTGAWDSRNARVVQADAGWGDCKRPLAVDCGLYERDAHSSGNGLGKAQRRFFFFNSTLSTI